MIYCFDTSGLNRLYRDPERDAIVQGLQATGLVYISALSVLEAAKTHSEKVRLSLLEFQSRLTREFRPLELPNVLIRRAAKDYARQAEFMTISIGEDNDGLWIGLKSPHSIGELGHREALEWSANSEAEFTAIHRNARPDFQKIFDEGTANRPISMSALLRHYMADEAFLFAVFQEDYQKATGKPLQKNELTDFLRAVPHWTFYYLGWACAVYQRAIQEHHYGPRRNPGLIDFGFATGCVPNPVENWRGHKPQVTHYTFPLRRQSSNLQ